MFHRLRLIVTVVAAFSCCVRADTIFVDDDNCPGPGTGMEGDPYCSIQTAIDNAVDTDEIVVAPGTYFENINFLGKTITLRSANGEYVTTIHGTGDFHVVQCVSGEGPDTVLEGFTITEDNVFDGGGMRNISSSPTVISCRFLWNSAGDLGSGGGMFNTGSSPTVTNCTFIGNAAIGGGGMANLSNSNPTVTDCVFSGNSVGAAGGGMYNNNSNPTVTNCTFSGNSSLFRGGGMANYVNSNPSVINCTFSGNSAEVGGGLFNISNSNPSVTNCTFSGNTSSTEGGGIYNDDFNGGSRPVVTNCILWDNSPDQVVDDGPSTTTISYSDVQGGFAGTGNINADPLFFEPAAGDLHLLPGSPCMDAGHNNAIANLADTDLDGNPRFADTPTNDTGCGIPAIVDMGAFEEQGDPFPVKFGDIDGDGIVGIVDFLAVLAAWGPCVEECCLADLDIDGNVGITDFLLLLGNWG